MLRKLTTVALSAVFALSCFAGCNPSQDEPHEIKNIIVIIGDGMGPVHVESGERYEEKNYRFTDWHQTQVDTKSYKAEGLLAITDSAAGGTAIATGTLTKNGYVGKSIDGTDLETVMDVAKSKGKTTAVVSTDNIYGATPASFSGHALRRDYTAEIVKSQILSSNVDLLCGAIADETSSDIIQTMVENNGYTYCDNFANVATTLTQEKAYWQFDMYGTGASVSLADVTAHALSFVERDADGFVMMLEQGHIDKYSHSNDFANMVLSMADLNNTVEVIMDWIGNRTDTAVLITADHETGRLYLNEEKNAYIQTHHTVSGKEMYYGFASTAHSDTLIGLYTYGIKPNFASFGTYSSKAKIKNIETGMIIKNLLLDPTMY